MLNTIQMMNEPQVLFIAKFFIYSFLGWCMECVVIRYEKGIWENRGFVRLPFCIIYGFGATVCYQIFSPLASQPVLVYFIGAISATIFELLVANIMLYFFGEFWWDYTNHKVQYKGMICLQSTVAWGFVALFVVYYLDGFVSEIVVRLSPLGIHNLSIFVLIAYSFDFMRCFYKSYQRKQR